MDIYIYIYIYINIYIYTFVYMYIYGYIILSPIDAQGSHAQSTLDAVYDEGCLHCVTDKSNCDLRPE